MVVLGTGRVVWSRGVHHRARLQATRDHGGRALANRPRGTWVAGRSRMVGVVRRSSPAGADPDGPRREQGSPPRRGPRGRGARAARSHPSKPVPTAGRAGQLYQPAILPDELSLRYLPGDDRPARGLLSDQPRFDLRAGSLGAAAAGHGGGTGGSLGERRQPTHGGDHVDQRRGAGLLRLVGAGPGGGH